MKKLKKYLFHFLAFFIPIFLVLLFFVILKIRYNDVKFLSSYEILMGDMKTQYISLMQYFSNVLHGKDSLIYSFSNSLGGNMISTFAYYLSSPLNLILFFATPYNISIIVFLLILIKFGLCGLTMYIYLNHKIKNNQFNAIIISSFYALMAYNVSYYFNTMWIDVVYLLPLVLLGIDDIIHNKKINKYVIFMSLSVFSNFYISYMLAIFSCLYFIYEMVITYSRKDKKEIFKCIKLFIFSSIISILVCSILLLPTIMDMQNMIRSSLSDSMYVRDNIYTNFLMLLSKLYALPNSANNVLSQFTPNVYYGILPFIFTISYFYSKDKLKNKIVTIVIILFFILGFSTNVFNLLWHGFSFPNGYAYRFSFLFSFFMLLIAYKQMCKNKVLNIYKFIILLCIVFFIGFTQLNDGSNICFNLPNILVTVGFLIIYYILVKVKRKKYISVIISILIVVELELLLNNSFITTRSFDYVANYSHYYDVVCKSSKKYYDINYKMDNQFVYSVLDGFSCHDSRLSSGLTTNNGDLYNFMYKNGFIATYSMIENSNNTPVIYSLLGINYYYDYFKDDYYDKVKFYFVDYSKKKKDYTNIYIHKNEYALPFGYIINNDYKKIFSKSNKSNPFEFQNALLKSMSGINKDCLKPYELSKESETNYKLTISNDKDIYFYLKHNMTENEVYFAEVTVNNKEVIDVDLDMSGVLKLKNKYEGKTIDVDISSAHDYYYENDDVLNFYYLDEDIFKEQIDELKETPFIVTKKENNKLSGKINADKDGTLFLSIPYEEGFDIKIDGKKVDYFKLYDAFVGINIKKGKHKIDIEFKLPGLKIGFIISLIGICILVFYNKKLKK